MEDDDKEILGKLRRFRIEIPYELKNGNNGQTKHWSSSAKERAKCKRIILDPNTNYFRWDGGSWKPCTQLPAIPSTHPVGLLVKRVYSGRQRAWDCDSILRGSAKQLIDSLAEAGVIEDDSPKYVEWALGIQEKGEHSCTVVTIYI